MGPVGDLKSSDFSPQHGEGALGQRSQRATVG